jgi:hypothetical protein
VARAPTEVLRRPDPLRLLAIDPKALVESVPLRDDVSVRSEIGHAREAMDGAREVVLDIFSQLKNGGGLDTKAVNSAVDSMVSSVFRNRDAMGWLARMRTKDDYLYSHSLSTSVWALTFGRHLGLDKETLKLLGTGAMLLARAGLLKGRPAITHHSAIEDLRAEGADVKFERVVDDVEIVTCGGVTAGLDLALWLVERFFGKEKANDTAAAVSRPISGTQTYRTNGRSVASSPPQSAAASKAARLGVVQVGAGAGSAAIARMRASQVMPER